MYRLRNVGILKIQSRFKILIILISFLKAGSNESTKHAILREKLEKSMYLIKSTTPFSFAQMKIKQETKTINLSYLLENFRIKSI